MRENEAVAPASPVINGVSNLKPQIKSVQRIFIEFGQFPFKAMQDILHPCKSATFCENSKKLQFLTLTLKSTFSNYYVVGYKSCQKIQFQMGTKMSDVRKD